MNRKAVWSIDEILIPYSKTIDLSIHHRLIHLAISTVEIISFWGLAKASVQNFQKLLHEAKQLISGFSIHSTIIRTFQLIIKYDVSHSSKIYNFHALQLFISFEFQTYKLQCAALSELNRHQHEYSLGVHLGCDIVLNGCHLNDWFSMDQPMHLCVCCTNPTRFHRVFQYEVNSIELNSIVWSIDAALCTFDLMTGCITAQRKTKYNNARVTPNRCRRSHDIIAAYGIWYFMHWKPNNGSIDENQMVSVYLINID